ncbi:MAG: GNAT family protein [Candidatus Nealsonbacteria bacterium]|nr:GNAT family protein [Candidatus Nealsonbacteria bacterium]
MTTYIKSKKIGLRKLKSSDASFISNSAKNKDVTRYTHIIQQPFNLVRAKKFIKKTQQDIKEKMAYEFGIELREKKELIGTINFLNINKKNKNSEIGIWISKEYWGQGLAKEALNLMLKFGFEKLKLERIQARVLHRNILAQNLFKKLGFKLEGKLRRKTYFKNKWYDDLVYGILRKEYLK